MSDHLLLISLGPIQDFIASARRCQDLWFGSWLLSDLSRATARALAAEVGNDALVFPGSNVEDVFGKPSVANKILVRVPPDKSPSLLAERGRSEMHDELERIYTRAFAHIGHEGFQRGVAVTQIDALMEYAWVSVPLGNIGAGAYAEARNEAERFLAARKNTRNWDQVTWGAHVPKSSLDGLRESVIHEDVYDPKKPAYLPPEKRREIFGLKGEERLCGVGLLKRLGCELDDEIFRGGRPRFHSTSHVASGPLRARLAARGDAVKAPLAAFAKALANAHVDLGRFRGPGGQDSLTTFAWDASARAASTPSAVALGGMQVDGYLFYPSRIEDVLLQNVPGERASSAKPKLESALREVLRAAEVEVGEPPAYYALLIADGDSMGKALDDLAHQGGIEAHRRFGRELDAFSVDCRGIVEQHAGSLVYAGGDDVLALLPLHTVLPCARALHDAFQRTTARAMEGADPSGPRPTLSVGVAITHHLTDMADARALAQRAEKLAKARDGKDALAILVDKRSGSELSLVAGWAEVPEVRMERWIRLLGLDVIPDKAVFDLEDAMAPLLVGEPGSGSRDGRDLNDVAAALAKRVLVRKQFDDESPLASDVTSIREELTRRFDEASNVRDAVVALSEELQIARAFLPAYRVAYGEPRLRPRREMPEEVVT